MSEDAQEQTEEDRLKETAYHEASHAVASFHLQRAFEYITIMPEGESLGHVRFGRFPKNFNPEIAPTLKGSDFIEKSTIIDLAGDVAVAVLRGRQDQASEDKGVWWDRHNAGNLLGYLTGSNEELQAYLNLQTIRARGIVRHPRNWAAIEALAAELLKCQRIGNRRAREIIRAAHEEWFQAEMARQKGGDA